MEARSAPLPAQPISAPPSQEGGDGRQGAGRPKANDALKPMVLSMECTPAEMRKWVKGFKAYFNSSGMEQCATEEQQAYLRAVLSTELDDRLEPHVSATTPIFGAGGCMEWLEKLFLQRYPMVTRRHQFFNATQRQGQAYADYEATVRRLGEEADLGKIDAEGLLSYKLMTGTTDARLRTKFMELQEPNLESIRREAAAYEAATVNRQTIEAKGLQAGPEGAAAHAVQPSQGGRRGTRATAGLPTYQNSSRANA